MSETESEDLVEVLRDVQDALNDLETLFNLTDEVLQECWDSNNGKKVQVPSLLEAIVEKLNWNKTQLGEYSGMIKYFIRHHPKWYISRGASGGILPRELLVKKQSVKALKAAIKRDIKAKIEDLVVAKVSEAIAETIDSETKIRAAINLDEEPIPWEDNLEAVDNSDFGF